MGVTQKTAVPITAVVVLVILAGLFSPSSVGAAAGPPAMDIDVFFGPDGELDAAVVRTAPQKTLRRPSVSTALPRISRRLAKESDDALPDERFEVTFVLKSSTPVPALPRFVPSEPRDSRQNRKILRRRVQILQNFARKRGTEQAWLVDFIEWGGGVVLERYAIGNIVAAELRNRDLRTLFEERRLRSIWKRISVQDVIPPPSVDDLLLDDVREITEAAGLFGLGFEATGYRVGTVDSGITEHQILIGRIGIPADCKYGGPDCQDEQAPDFDSADCVSNQSGNSGHGTSTAAIIAGTDALGEENSGLTDATVDSWKVSNVSFVTGKTTCQVENNEAFVPVRALQNAVLHDEVIVGNQQFGVVAGEELVEPMNAAVDEAYAAGAIIISAAGNRGPGPGTVTSPGSARNTLAIGAFGRDYTGEGPTEDGRIKPDVLMPTDIHTANAGGPNSFWTFTGTSAATPVGGGLATIVLDLYDASGGLLQPPSDTPGRIYATLLAFGQEEEPDSEEGAGLVKLGQTSCSRWRWGSRTIGSLQNQIIAEPEDTKIFVVQGGENVRAAIWWSNAPQGGEGGPHRPMTLALVKGQTVHMGSAVENSVFQLLRADSIGPGTWTLSIEAIQGAPPGLTRVHYFLYYELPDISCTLFGN